MSLNLEGKKAVVAEVSAALVEAKAAVLAEYRGLTVAQMTLLRTNARKSGIYLRVVKNTLLRRAMDGSPFACLHDHLIGPLVFAVSKDPVAVAKVVSDFAKDHEKFLVKASSLDGKLMARTDMEALAKLPSREVLLSMLMGAMQAPAQKFVQTLNEVPARFVRTLAALRDRQANQAA